MLTLRVVGEMALEAADGRPRPLPDRAAGRVLLAWLALHPGPHARAEIAARLWPEATGERGRASLRAALASVRRAVGDDHLRATRTTVGLCDVHVQSDGDGDLLQGLDDDWVLAARDEHRAGRSRALAEAADAAQAAGDLDRAVELTRRRLALEPLAEPVARDLIRRLAAAGDRAGALLAYGRLAERMHDELRLLPSPETRRVAAELRGEAQDGAAGHAPPAADDLPSDERALAGLPAGASAAERSELLLALAAARRRAAAPGADVRATFLLAAEHARRAGRGERLAEAAIGVCTVPFFPGDEPVDAVAVALLEEALEHAEPALAVRLRAFLVRERLFAGDAAATAAESASVIEQARALGDRHALVTALDARSLAVAGTATPGERRALADEMLDAADDPGLRLRARQWRVVAALEEGDLEAPAREAAHFERPGWRWLPALWRAMRALADGELEEGERLAWAAYAIGEAPFGERAALELQSQLFYVRWRQDRLDELDATAGAMAGRYGAIPAWRCVKALVDARLGRLHDARRELDGLTIPADLNRLVGLSLHAQAALALGDPALVERAHEALGPFADRRPVSGYGGLVLEPLGETRARLAERLDTALPTSARPS